MLGNTDSTPAVRSMGNATNTPVVVAQSSSAKSNSYTRRSLVSGEVYSSIVNDGKQYQPLVIESPYGPIIEAVDITQKDFKKKFKKINKTAQITNLDDRSQIKVFASYYQPVEPKKGLTWDTLTKEGVNGSFVPLPAPDPNEYQWNLPPHKWSLPYFASNDPESTPNGFVNTNPNDRYRRGRIWWKWSDENIRMITKPGEDGLALSNIGRKYGFQFLWNPESFSTAVAVQMDATPNSNDRFLGTVGAFPATETISFNVRIDRTNDFACANTLLARPSNISFSSAGNKFIDASDVQKFIQFYRSGFSAQSSVNKETISSKLIDLFQRGTIADIEFLYMAINGAGPGDGQLWQSPRGIATADIGFLQPTLLNIDVGPLSYQGYVTSMSVTHLAFTQDMTPIRSDVQISLNLLATAGLTSTYAESQE